MSIQWACSNLQCDPANLCLFGDPNGTSQVCRDGFQRVPEKETLQGFFLQPRHGVSRLRDLKGFLQFSFGSPISLESMGWWLVSNLCLCSILDIAGYGSHMTHGFHHWFHPKIIVLFFFPQSLGPWGTFQDNYTALYFIGCRGEELIHHLPCLVHKLTMQRLTVALGGGCAGDKKI